MNFPQTRLVEEIKHEAHPVGRYIDRGRPPRIEFSRVECSKLDEDSLRFAVYHEVGHWWRISFVDRSILKEHGYGDGDAAEERFADAFANFFVEENPDDKLVKHFGDISLRVHGFEDQICSFAEQVFDELRENLGLERKTVVASIKSARR